MRICLRTETATKHGNSSQDFEDAVSPVPGEVENSDVFRCAIADGATESSFAGEWARLLTSCWCQANVGAATYLRGLPELGRAWEANIDRTSLPWYAEAKIEQGAFAAFLGMTLRHNGTNRMWQAMAVGDSCLFQVRRGCLLRAFPLTRTEQFNSRPVLLSSNAASNRQACEQARRTRGSWQSGDIFYLMTDALACWFLSTVAGRRLSSAGLPNHGDSFADAITALREAHLLRNDDVTLVTLEVS